MSSVITKPVEAQDIVMSFVTTGTPVEDLSKIISYPGASYDEGFAVYSTTESFMFGFLNEFTEASHIFPVKCGLYTDDYPSLTVPKNNEDHTCKDTVLDKLTIKCAEDYIAVNDNGFTEASTKCVEVSASNLGVRNDADEDIMEAIIQYEYEDFVEMSFIQSVPQ